MLKHSVKANTFYSMCTFGFQSSWMQHALALYLIVARNGKMWTLKDHLGLTLDNMMLIGVLDISLCHYSWLFMVCCCITAYCTSSCTSGDISNVVLSDDPTACDVLVMLNAFSSQIVMRESTVQYTLLFFFHSFVSLIPHIEIILHQ